MNRRELAPEVSLLLGLIDKDRRRSAKDFHDAAEAALRAAGIQTTREVLVPLPGRRRSRVDLVLDGWFALELDRKGPRKKSEAKIRAFGAGMVYCRESGRISICNPAFLM